MDRSNRVIAALGAALLLTGCLTGVPNPTSLAIHTANASASQAMGMAAAGEITPAEKAKYAAMSCVELNQLTANYETALKMAPSAPVKNNAVAKSAMGMQVITTRLAYLREQQAIRKC